ncbi:hypothetical protein E0L36_04720 [Streptomyces sp. AJS327]|nr:hypothetical protein [Streptomyces sp. AJS327]
MGPTPADRAVLLLGVPLLGAVLGLVLPWVADWVAGLRWAPMQGPFELVASFGDGFGTRLACVGGGGVLGIGVGCVLLLMCMRLTVDGTTIQVEADGDTQRVDGTEVHVVFVDGGQLVLLDAESRQLLREKCEPPVEAVAVAFTEHGYAWREGDPYAGLYRRWVPDLPDLPYAVHVLLKARETALRKKSRTDIRELRHEVQKLGYVVRDESTRQFWRPLVRS